MADTAALRPQHTHPMPLLAHLEELRKRLILSVIGVVVGFLSCWSFADRIFALVQQPLIPGTASPWARRWVGVFKPN